MAVKDNIQALNIEEQVKVYKERTANSIRFRQESVKLTKENYAKLLRLIAEREEKLNELKNEVNREVELKADYNAIIGNNIVLAKKIEFLENEINILSNAYGPMEAVGHRAIRLIDRMYKEARTKSNDIYSNFDANGKYYDIYKGQVPLEEAVTDIAPTSDINVEKIAAENKETIGQSIENAISEEKSLEENNVKEEKIEIPTIPQEQIIVQVPSIPTEPVAVVEPTPVVPETAPVVVESAPVVPETAPVVVEPTLVVPETAPVVVEPIDSETMPIEEVASGEPIMTPVVEEVVSTEPEISISVEEPSTEIEIDRAEHERIINDELAEFEAGATDKVLEQEQLDEEDYEYVPMTDEEIARAKENIELDKYNQIYAEEARKAREVAEANEIKGFDIESIPTEIDNSEEVEEAEIKGEETLRDEVVIAPDRPEPEEARHIVASEELKEELEEHQEESIEELAKLIEEEEKKAKEKQRARENSEAELKRTKENHEKLIENETNTEQNLADLQAEREAKQKELNELKVRLNRKLKSLKNKNSSIDDDIQRNQEELSSIKEDDDMRNERLAKLNQEVDSEQESINQIGEMLDKYGFIEEESDEKTR